MKLETVITGLREAISFFDKLGPNLEIDVYEGMLEAAGELSGSIDRTVPHRGTHLIKSGADYHIFRIEENPNIPEIRCGPTAPYVPILEYGSAAMQGEFEPVYRITKQGQLLIGLRFVYQGASDIFYLAGGKHIRAFNYLRDSVINGWERMKLKIVESAKRAVRRS